MKMRLGADPEVFLLDSNQGDKPISVIGLIGADKWNPLPMHDLPEGFTLQEDNVAMEFGIPPAASADEFVSHMKTVMDNSLSYVYTGLKFSQLSVIIFPKDQLEHPLASVFGCEPDYNAWTGKANPRPKAPNPDMRSAGGHIHVETDQDPIEVVKKADLFLSIPLVLMEPNGLERKQAYGKAGAHRKKPYGVEYRTPSNWWIFEEARVRWAWRNMQRALECNIDMSVMADTVQQCINTNDKTLAHAFVNAYELEVL